MLSADQTLKEDVEWHLERDDSDYDIDDNEQDEFEVESLY